MYFLTTLPARLKWTLRIRNYPYVFKSFWMAVVISGEIIIEIRKYPDLGDNKNILYKQLWKVAKAVLK